jgi:hypothetical protein
VVASCAMDGVHVSWSWRLGLSFSRSMVWLLLAVPPTVVIHIGVEGPVAEILGGYMFDSFVEESVGLGKFRKSALPPLLLPYVASPS